VTAGAVTEDPAYERWRRRVRVAQGLEPADTVIAGAAVLNVFTQELVPAEVAIADGVIAGVGPRFDARERLDRPGMVVAPSFIDGHLHIESTMLQVPDFARAVVPHGTGAVIADPHEIANVAGLRGVEAMRASAAGLPMLVRWTAPSCVPASARESPGATFGVEDIRAMRAWPDTVGLGEMMDFPGLLGADREVFDKLAAAGDLPRDGHSPGLRGAAVQAYVAAGIASDHESTELAEARDKLAAGMMLMLRQGSSEKNVLDLLPLVNDATWRRCCFGSDDRDAHDLLHNGHVDDILRTVIDAGLDPVRAITMATWNVAQHWRLWHIGAVAAGYDANLVLLDGDLSRLTVRETWFAGQVVARDGVCTVTVPAAPPPAWLTHTVNVAPVHLSDLRLPAGEATRAVEVIPDQIVTRCLDIEPPVADGLAVADPARGLLKLACVERHHASGRVGVGMVAGIGLERGAIAGSIGHDAHNIMVVGASDIDMLAAIATVAEMQGGLAVVAGGEVLAALPLPVAGLMSDQPLEAVATDYARVEAAARSLGATAASPFGQLAFLGISVIPAARVTDRGFLEVG
jgi:adenine deaminase